MQSFSTFGINFILCHEYVHIDRLHAEQRMAGKNSLIDRLEFEKEVDELSAKLIWSGADDAKKERPNLGLFIGLSCLLYFKNETLSTTHPDTDKRIDSYLQTLNAPSDDPIWGIASLAFRLWDHQFGKLMVWPKTIKDFREM